MRQNLANTTKKRPATIQDIADEVGVSKMTVSLVLADKGSISPATRLAVQQAAQRLNFVPNPHARRLSQGGSPNMIGLFSLRLDLGTSTLKMQRIQAALSAKGYDVPAYAYDYRLHTPTNVIPSLVNLRQQRPRAIVCNAAGLPQETLEELRLYLQGGGIVVCYDSPIEIDCDRVIFDRLENTYLGTRHLLELGHRHIGFSEGSEINRAGLRHAGFKQALQEFKVEARDEWFLKFAVSDLEEFYDGERVAESFLQLKERPTAMCFADDQTAMAFICKLIRSGVRVPEDVSVVGADDAPVARNSIPSLTTVTHPAKAIAHEVVQLLLSRLEEGYNGPSREIIISSELKIRESTKPPQ